MRILPDNLVPLIAGTGVIVLLISAFWDSGIGMLAGLLVLWGSALILPPQDK